MSVPGSVGGDGVPHCGGEGGLKDLRELVGVLAISAGAENNSDNLTQNFTVGTANVNLRGLGVASTLVLLNGRRQVLSAVQTDDGSSFVDLAALVPMLALERVEVLKDGAAAIYGSQEDFSVDAVAGGTMGADGQVPAGGEPSRSHEPPPGRGGLAASLDRRFWQSRQLPRAVHGPHAGGPGLRGVRRSGAGTDGRGAICRFDYAPQITVTPNERRTQLFGRMDWRREARGMRGPSSAMRAIGAVSPSARSTGTRASTIPTIR